MLLFRSEEHVDRWVEQGHGPKGAILTLDQLWGLAREWYRTRMEPGWRRRSPEEAEALFSSLALTGEFWTLRS
jgi:hypothetical protein